MILIVICCLIILNYKNMFKHYFGFSVILDAHFPVFFKQNVSHYATKYEKKMAACLTR
jgi:hypothetical protein